MSTEDILSQRFVDELVKDVERWIAEREQLSGQLRGALSLLQMAENWHKRVVPTDILLRLYSILEPKSKAPKRSLVKRLGKQS